MGNFFRGSIMAAQVGNFFRGSIMAAQVGNFFPGQLKWPKYCNLAQIRNLNLVLLQVPTTSLELAEHKLDKATNFES
jgi:hypothetical protein